MATSPKETCRLTFETIRSRSENLSLDTNMSEWISLTNNLENVTTLLKEESNRNETNADFFNDISKIIKTASELLSRGCEMTPVVQTTTTECYRCLRNSCAGSPRNQQLIYQQPGILENTFTISERLLPEVSDPDTAVLLRCAVQFVGNFVVGNPEHQDCVWQKFSPIFRGLVSCCDDKLAQYTCMVLHTCLSGYCSRHDDDDDDDDDRKISVVSSDDGKSLIISVLDALQTTDSEWALYCVEDVLKFDKLWTDLSSLMSDQHRLLLLEVMLKLLQDEDAKSRENFSDLPVCESNLKCVATEFNNLAHTVLQLNSEQQKDMEPSIVVKSLEVLCLATTSPDKYSELRDDQDLVKSCLCLLKGIHEIGKIGGNMFSSVQKLSQAGNVNSDHPSYGLKRDLVRLIGNMTYKQRTNQDLVRQLDGIPLILDQTNIDERNPYITQWAVFAIHNLCEENQENMAILAGLRRQGLADNVDVLQGFGVEAEIKDDKIIVKPPSAPS